MFDVRLPNLRWLEERGSLPFLEDTEFPQDRIMFYGDSGFTRWASYCGHRPLEEDIRRKDGSPAAINHGFGTSTAEELLYYYPRAVLPWKPRALVLLAYGNDMGAGYSPSEVMSLLARVLDYARHDIPGIRLYLCDHRPALTKRTPAGIDHEKEFNALCRMYCELHPDTTLVRHADCAELYQPGHAGDPEFPRPDIYVEDKVHFNQAGYDIYRDFFLKILDDIL